ncbi:hypothetical protein Vafri_14461, partial [Volvox africanus]
SGRGGGDGITSGGGAGRFGAVTNARLRVSVSSVAPAGPSGRRGEAGGQPRADQPFSGAVAGTQALSHGHTGGSGAAPPSSVLLAQIRSRQQAVRGAAVAASLGEDLATPDARHGGSGSGSGSGTIPAVSRVTAAERLCGNLLSFLEERNGVVGSEELVEAFRSRVVPEQMPLFKQVLRQVAGLRRRAGGGEWVLKPEFATATAVAADASSGGGNTDGGIGGGESSGGHAGGRRD